MDPAFVRSERVVFPDGTRPATILIAGGRIAAVRPIDDVPAGATGIDAGSLVVLPGLVDTHVHVNEPGRSDWEGFAHATRAAAAGGVTTLVDMPLNSLPATVSVDALDAKLRAGDGQIHVDVGFWGGVVPGNASAIESLVGRGVLGFKCFLSPSGVDEFPHVADPDLRRPWHGWGCRCWSTRSCPRSCASPIRALTLAPIAPGSTRGPTTASGPPSS